MPFKTLDDLDLAGRKVLIRLDLNLPLDNGVIADPTRLERALPTIRDVLAKGATPILLSHFGRPKGKADPAQSLRFCVDPLANALSAPVAFAEDCVGDAAAQAIAGAPAGGVVLLENTRFHAGEEANDAAFADALAALGDVYVNDAFSAAHRAHASTEGLARRLPAAAGRNMQAELQALAAALGNPARPAIAIVGGAKVSTKLKVLGHLATKVDQIVIGGGMANTFLLARGLPVGKSLAEPDLVDAAKAVDAQAQAAGCQIVLPIDIVVARAFKAHAAHEVLPADGCPDDGLILDAGPQTVADLERRFTSAKTVVWNGPLGAFETPPFDAATMAAAKAAAALSTHGALTAVAGGGDTVAALNAAGVADQFTYVSTAGGAFLEWMEGATLPGVAALEAAA